MTSQKSSGKPKKPKVFLVRRVVGKSMAPVLDSGQLVLAVRRRRYFEDDVVVIFHGGKEKIKRLYEIRGSQFDVRGDNPAHSTDSRHFGLIDAEDVLGKVVWPQI